MTKEQLLQAANGIITAQGFNPSEPEMEGGSTVVRLLDRNSGQALGSVTIYRSWEELTPEGAEGIIRATIMDACRAIVRQMTPK